MVLSADTRYRFWTLTKTLFFRQNCLAKTILNCLNIYLDYTLSDSYMETSILKEI